MNLEELYNKIGTEYQHVLARFCGNEVILSKFVRSFGEDPTYGKLAEAVDAYNEEETEQYAHALKGVSANLGFERLHAACAQVVLDVRQGKPENIPGDFQILKQEYELVTELIKKSA